jgi:DNA-binding response OmpR family regulator
MREPTNVLVVEDDAATRDLLSLTLEADNYHVVTAMDGQEALDAVKLQRPDVILLDLMLPRVDGWQVIESLDDGSDCIPIITMSAGQRYWGVGEHGVKAFLSKPYHIDSLLTVLDEVTH